MKPTLLTILTMLSLSGAASRVTPDYDHPFRLGVLEIDTVKLDGGVYLDTAWVIKYPYTVVTGLRQKAHKDSLAGKARVGK